MCGLIYKHDFTGKPVNGYVMQQYDAQRSRGTEGFGLFNGVHLVHAAMEDRILNWLVKEKNDSDMILFHHRNPTSTINCRKAAHPFTTKDFFGDTEYVLIHNGYMQNELELIDEHEALGISYQSLLDDGTFNDSESLLWDFALYQEGHQDELKARGVIAFICMKLVKGKPVKLMFGRNTNPLIMVRTKDSLQLSSEGEGQLIESHELYTWHYQSKRLTHRALLIPNYSYSNYGTYSSTTDYGSYGTGKGSQGVYNWQADDEDDKVRDWLAEHLTQYGKKAKRVSYIPMPTAAETESCAFHYLNQVMGNFQAAYWNMEDDLEDLEMMREPDNETLAAIRLIREAQKYLKADPEYVNKDSISSIWRELWQQTKLLETL